MGGGTTRRCLGTGRRTEASRQAEASRRAEAAGPAEASHAEAARGTDAAGVEAGSAETAGPAETGALAGVGCDTGALGGGSRRRTVRAQRQFCGLKWIRTPGNSVSTIRARNRDARNPMICPRNHTPKALRVVRP
jgi:hypothetical protein